MSSFVYTNTQAPTHTKKNTGKIPGLAERDLTECDLAECDLSECDLAEPLSPELSRFDLL